MNIKQISSCSSRIPIMINWFKIKINLKGYEHQIKKKNKSFKLFEDVSMSNIFFF